MLYYYCYKYRYRSEIFGNFSYYVNVKMAAAAADDEDFFVPPLHDAADEVDYASDIYDASKLQLCDSTISKTELGALPATKENIECAPPATETKPTKQNSEEAQTRMMRHNSVGGLWQHFDFTKPALICQQCVPTTGKRYPDWSEFRLTSFTRR